MACERLRLSGDGRAARGRAARAGPGAGLGQRGRVGDRRRGARRRRPALAATTPRRFDTGGADAAAAAGRRRRARRAPSTALDPRCARAWSSRSTTSARSLVRASASDRSVELGGHRVLLREAPVARGGRLRPGRARAVSEHGRDGRRHRARRRRRRGRGVRAARPRRRGRPGDPGRLPAGGRDASTGWAAPRRSPRSPTGPRRSSAGRRDRRPGQPVRAGGQAPGFGRGRDRRLRRAQRPGRDRRRATPTPSRSRSTCSPRPSTAPGRWSSAPRRRADAARRARTRALGRGPDTGAVARLVDVDRARAGARRWPRRSRPSTSQLVGAGAEALAPRVTHAGCVFVGAAAGTAFGDYIAGSNHVLPTDGAARFASGLSPRHFRRRFTEVRIGDAPRELARAAAPVARAEFRPQLFQRAARTLAPHVRVLAAPERGRPRGRAGRARPRQHHDDPPLRPPGESQDGQADGRDPLEHWSAE